MHKIIALVVSALTMGQAMAADADPLWLTVPSKDFAVTFPDQPMLIITAEGVVTTKDGVPLDELPPAGQIEALCGVLGLFAGVTIKRCGKPAP